MPAQPASVTALADVVAADLARAEVAPAHSEIAPASASDGELDVLLLRRRSVAPSARTITVACAPSASGLRELALERAARVVGVGREAGAAELRHRREHGRPRTVVLDGEEDVDPGLRGLGCPARASDRTAARCRAEADARRRWPADLLDQAVVAPAAARSTALAPSASPTNSKVVRV